MSCLHLYTPGGAHVLTASQYWVPRVRLLFCAEDPRVFAERLCFAQRQRQSAEALMFYHLAVDCMPVWAGTPSLDTQSLRRIRGHVLSTPGLKLQT